MQTEYLKKLENELKIRNYSFNIIKAYKIFKKHRDKKY